MNNLPDGALSPITTLALIIWAVIIAGLVDLAIDFCQYFSQRYRETKIWFEEREKKRRAEKENE